MKTTIHVNRHNIAHNKKGGEPKPVFTAVTHRGREYGNSIVCDGPVEFFYTPDKPLGCGATAYVVTHGRVIVK